MLPHTQQENATHISENRECVCGRASSKFMSYVFATTVYVCVCINQQYDLND